MSVVIADKSAAARMEKPIMTTLTDREKALYEIAKECRTQGRLNGEPRWFLEKFDNILRAYDPPKEKVYVMPTWDEFAKGQLKADFSEKITAVGFGPYFITDSGYNALREASAKEQE